MSLEAKELFENQAHESNLGIDSVQVNRTHTALSKGRYTEDTHIVDEDIKREN